MTEAKLRLTCQCGDVPKCSPTKQKAIANLVQSNGRCAIPSCRAPASRLYFVDPIVFPCGCGGKDREVDHAHMTRAGFCSREHKFLWMADRNLNIWGKDGRPRILSVDDVGCGCKGCGPERTKHLIEDGGLRCAIQECRKPIPGVTDSRKATSKWCMTLKCHCDQVLDHAHFIPMRYCSTKCQRKFAKDPRLNPNAMSEEDKKAPGVEVFTKGDVSGALECEKCHKKETGAKFPKCGRCKRVVYCSGACQKEDWKKHKVGCVASDQVD